MLTEESGLISYYQALQSSKLPSLVASSHLFWYFKDSWGSKVFSKLSYFCSASAMYFAWGEKKKIESLPK
jgi:hypothetical protein